MYRVPLINFLNRFVNQPVPRNSPFSKRSAALDVHGPTHSVRRCVRRAWAGTDTRFLSSERDTLSRSRLRVVRRFESIEHSHVSASSGEPDFGVALEIVGPNCPDRFNFDSTSLLQRYMRVVCPSTNLLEPNELSRSFFFVLGAPAKHHIV